MNNLERYVKTFPDKIISKMTPPGTSINRNHLDRYQNCLSFNSCDFWFEADKSGFLVKIDARMDKKRVEELLKKPERLSNAKLSTKKEYNAIVCKGKLLEEEEEGTLRVYYRVENDRGLDAVFNAFYYQFKPLLVATLPAN